MMDPVTVIGLTASLGQLINAAAQLVCYINGVRNGPKDRARLALECANLVAFLTEFRYEIEDLNLKDPWLTGIQLLAEKNGPMEQLTQAVIAILEKLRPESRSGGIVKAMIWPIEKKGVDDILSQIERLKAIISLHRQSDHFRIALRTHDIVLDVKEGLEQEQKDREQQEVLQWISILEFSKKQADYLVRSQKGTGEWFLKGKAFTTWLDGPPRTLWCHGQPGAGKTILTSLVIDHLEHRFRSNTGVAYIYFSYLEHDSQTADSLVASLLRQFAQRNREVSPGISATRLSHLKRGSRPTCKEWSSLLLSEIRRFPKAFIIVDALDECPEDGIRDSFMQEIRRLQPTAHILITSRLIQSIGDVLFNALKVEIKAPDADVKEYLEDRVRSESRLVRLLRGDTELQATVVKSIVENARGMFLLAQLQMDSVAKKTNRRDIRRSLARLPQKLNDTYSEAMRRIWSQSREDIDLALRLLSWVVFANRPLGLIEVQHALAVEKGDTDLDREGIPDEDLMIPACAGLVTIDSESTTIRLVHYTAREYLERTRASHFPRAQVDITSTCLTYLSFTAIDAKNYPVGSLEALLERYPFVVYAVQFWGEHARGDPEVTLESTIVSFLKNSSRTETCHRISTYLRQGYENTTKSSSSVTGLHIAAWFGLSRIVGSLISSCDIDINASDPAGETPLHWAARNGRVEVVEELLDHPDINADISNLRGLTPLSLAAMEGHIAVVRLLLERKDVAPNTRDPFHLKSPLWRAVDGGHKDVAKVLLAQPNVLVNSPDTIRGQTPLWRAAANGNASMVQLLLEQPGVDINVPDAYYGSTPLSEALAQGHSAVVQLLLAHPDIKIDTSSKGKGE